jgi:hypothetical protein
MLLHRFGWSAPCVALFHVSSIATIVFFSQVLGFAQLFSHLNANVCLAMVWNRTIKCVFCEFKNRSRIVQWIWFPYARVASFFPLFAHWVNTRNPLVFVYCKQIKEIRLICVIRRFRVSTAASFLRARGSILCYPS